jgi:hypothetical protein
VCDCCRNKKLCSCEKVGLYGTRFVHDIGRRYQLTVASWLCLQLTLPPLLVLWPAQPSIVRS